MKPRNIIPAIMILGIYSVVLGPCHAAEDSLRITVVADSGEVAMGRSVSLNVAVQDGKGDPAKNCLLLTYVNEQLAWLHEKFVQNPRFHDLWVMHEGKPLITFL